MRGMRIDLIVESVSIVVPWVGAVGVDAIVGVDSIVAVVSVQATVSDWGSLVAVVGERRSVVSH